MEAERPLKATIILQVKDCEFEQRWGQRGKKWMEWSKKYSSGAARRNVELGRAILPRAISVGVVIL